MFIGCPWRSDRDDGWRPLRPGARLASLTTATTQGVPSETLLSHFHVIAPGCSGVVDGAPVTDDASHVGVTLDDDGVIDPAAVLRALTVAAARAAPADALLVLDDAGALLGASPGLQAGTSLLVDVLALAAPRGLGAGRPAGACSVALRLPAGCAWDVGRSPAHASVSLPRLLAAVADAAVTVSPLPSGHSRDVHGRAVAAWSPVAAQHSAGDGARDSDGSAWQWATIGTGFATAGAGALYRVTDAAGIVGAAMPAL